MNKIYIVEYYGGQWEDSWNAILGVFDSLELAKQEETNFLIKINEVKKNQPPYPTDELLLENDVLYDKLWLKNYEYWEQYSSYKDVAGTRIQEFELNKVKI